MCNTYNRNTLVLRVTFSKGDVAMALQFSFYFCALRCSTIAITVGIAISNSIGLVSLVTMPPFGNSAGL